MTVAGLWNINLKSPMGKESGTLELRHEGDSLTGTMSNKMGALDISEGAVDGSTVSFKAYVTSPMKLTMAWTGVVDGDAISGTVKLGMMGKASFKGTRAS